MMLVMNDMVRGASVGLKDSADWTAKAFLGDQ
jgi:hypothetical protein